MRLTRMLCYATKLPKNYSNFPERYIERAKEQIEFKTEKAPQFQDKVIKREVFTYGIHRPWTKAFYEENMPGKYIERDVVEPIKEWTIYRGDKVQIMKGKDKGKQGIVNYIVTERNWVTVEGLNCEYKYVGGSYGIPKQLIKEELPLLVTNEVALVDPADNKPTKAVWRFTDEGEEVRVSVRSGRLIPMPKMAEETYDYKEKQFYTGSYKKAIEKLREAKLTSNLECSNSNDLEALTEVRMEPGSSEWENPNCKQQSRQIVSRNRERAGSGGEVFGKPNEHQYYEQPKDTSAKDTAEITYKPKLMTFEQEIMQEMGIKEDRKPVKTYWY